MCGVFAEVSMGAVPYVRSYSKQGLALDLSSTQWRVVVMGLVVGRIFRWTEMCVSHGSLHV